MVIWPCTRLVSEVYSHGTIPRNPDSSAGLAKRLKLPISAHSPAAVSVSIPRKHRSRAIVSAEAALRCCLLEHPDQRLPALRERIDRAEIVSERCASSKTRLPSQR